MVALICAILPMYTVVSFSVISTPKSQQTSPTSSIELSNDDDILKEMQRKHRPIAESFQPNKFNPHPLFTNPHLQTISGVFLRKNQDCAYVADSGIGGIAKVINALLDVKSKEDTSKLCTYYDERQRVTTSCQQDFFSVDIKYAGERKTQYQSTDSKGLVILIHGLESNSNSSLSTDMAEAYIQDGFDVAFLNFRGCCGEPNDTIGGYHLGFTDDLLHFLTLIRNKFETEDNFDKRPVYLSGFSLGANVVIKCLGELGDAAMSLYNIHGAAVTGAPFDAEKNILKVDAPGFNNIVYGGSFLKTMKQRAQFQLEQFCDGDPDTDKFDYKGCMSATTIAEYENAFLPNVYGFEDNIDYYRCTSCYYFLGGVAVPLLIINAGDDPFFDPDFFPIEKSVDGGNDDAPPIKMERTEFGGHLGYMAHQPSDIEKKRKQSTSWMPMELSRFISHVHSYTEEEH